MDIIKVGIIGAGGYIGSALTKLLYTDTGYITRHKCNVVPVIVYDLFEDKIDFVRNFKDPPRIAKDAWEVIHNPEADIIVEATGKDEEALEFGLETFKNYKSLVTPNKLVVAKNGERLFAEAEKYGQGIDFDAAVMGGVVVTDIFRETADIIEWYEGILNGTSNYILYKMAVEEKDFMEVLKEAQDKGYAEPDSIMDISGKDTHNKNIILAMLAFGTPVDYKLVMGRDYVDGIQNVEKIDLMRAKQLADSEGYVVKLVGKAKLKDGKVSIGTHPTLVTAKNRLSQTEGVFNGLVYGNARKGRHYLEGMGAGDLPTSTDILEGIIRTWRRKKLGKPYVPFTGNEIEILDPLEDDDSFYLRFNAIHMPGALSEVTRILGKEDVNIERVIQKPEYPLSKTVPLAMLTKKGKVRNLIQAIEGVDKELQNKAIEGKPVVMRVENSDGI